MFGCFENNLLKYLLEAVLENLESPFWIFEKKNVSFPKTKIHRYNFCKQSTKQVLYFLEYENKNKKMGQAVLKIETFIILMT